MEYRIAIVNSSSFGTRFPDQLERLEAIGPVERVRVDGTAHGAELAEALDEYNVVISSVTPFFDAEFFDRKRDLLLISRHGIGYNNIDIAAANAAGTVVTTVPPLVERDAVAEGSAALLMDVMRRVSDSHEAAEDGRWAERATFVGNGLSGKTLGIIGCGNIGSRVVEILARGFDMNVLAYDPKPRPEWAASLPVDFAYASLEDVLAACDVLTLNADLNPTSYHILDERALELLKPGAYVVNNARADLIDQPAMLAALDNGAVKGLALDVMHDEPPSSDDPYFHHPKVLVCPHISAYTEECLRNMGEKCVGDVERLVAGEPPVNEIRA